MASPILPYADVAWSIKLYDLDGNELEDLSCASDRRLSYPLNTVDSFSCSLYLDDAAAPNVRVLDRVIRVWRTITDTARSVTYEDPEETPCFTGYVTGTTKNGEANQMQVTAINPFWRLQNRFHIDNHLFVKDFVGSQGNEDNDFWDQSALMWRLIYIISHAFGDDSHTGIIRPPTGPDYWPRTIPVYPFRVPRGANTWQLIFDDIMNRPRGCDLVPQYILDPDHPDYLMYFMTDTVRGVVNTDFSFDYCTGDMNLADLSEDTQITQGGFANYVEAYGQGGPNVSRGFADNPTGTYASGRPGHDNVGMYMHQAADPRLAQVRKPGALNDIAESELKKTGIIPHTYSIQVSPAGGIYFAHDYGTKSGSRFFGVGDSIELNADKGALVVSAAQQRIHEVDISLSDNAVETYSITLADDFYGKHA